MLERVTGTEPALSGWESHKIGSGHGVSPTGTVPGGLVCPLVTRACGPWMARRP